jgi:hypothetical protein
MSAHPGLTLSAIAMLAWVPTVAPEASDLHKVVVEGETLPDGTTLQTIVAACSEQAPFRPCVAISPGGRVAFYGTTGTGADAILTQHSVVVESDEVLPDGTTLGIDSSSIVGGLARNIRTLAFPGLEVDTSTSSTTNALFTPEGLVVKQGDTLPDGSTASINFLGGAAINARAQVAFHGSNAVFTQDGTLVGARQELPDGTIAKGISFFGGVASSGLSGRVAFQGFTDNQLVIFTQDGLVAKAGTLPDGTELQSIDPLASMAMSPRGEVVFHGRTDGYDAVFNQRRLLARAGTRLRHRTRLDAIRPEGGIAVNDRGIVVFHGESHGEQAVFSQKGLIARVGDRVRGGGRLEAIRAEGGIAINGRGQVAFHGVTGGKAAIFVTGAGGRR